MLPSTILIKYHLRDQWNTDTGVTRGDYTAPDGQIEVEEGGSIKVTYKTLNLQSGDKYSYGGISNQEINFTTVMENNQTARYYSVEVPVQEGKELFIYLHNSVDSYSQFLIEAVPAPSSNMSAFTPNRTPLKARRLASAAEAQTTDQTGYAPLDEKIARIGYTDAQGEHKYYIVDQYAMGETLGAADGWTKNYAVDLDDLSGNAWEYYFVETDPTSGWTTTYSGQDPDGLTNGGTTVITNKQEPQEGALRFAKTVTVNGSPSAALNGVYSFSVTGPAPASETVATVQIKVINGNAAEYRLNGAEEYTALPADGYVVISNLAEGDYTITETPVSGMTATVSGGSGSASETQSNNVTVHVTAGENTPGAAATATFNNNKEVGSLSLQKLVENYGASDVSDQAFSFTVTLTAPSGVTFDASYPTATTPEGGAEVVGSANAGSPITVTLKAGDIWRIDNLPKGTSYVISEGDLPEGWLLASATGQSGTIGGAGTTETAVFTNRYVETTAKPVGIKTLEGRNWNNDTFNFTLTPTGQTLTAVADGAVKLPAGANTQSPYAISATATQNSGSGSVSIDFGDITFLQEGEYTFAMQETAGSDEHIQYAGNTVTVQVLVEKNTETGALQSSVSYTNTADGAADNEFINAYSASVFARIEAAKAMQGGEAPATGAYSFILTANGDAPMPQNASEGECVTTNNGAVVAFGDIAYTLSDMATTSAGGDVVYAAEKEFTYTLTESVPQEANEGNGYIASGIQYDPTEYTVTVKVAYDEQTGALTIVEGYPQYKKGSTEAAPTFVNRSVKDFAFKKAWAGLNTSWPEGEEITVDLYRQLKNGDAMVAGTLAKVTSVSLNANGLAQPNALLELAASTSDGATTFTFRNLDAKGTVDVDGSSVSGDWIYYVKETGSKLDKSYGIAYIDENGNVKTGENYALNGETIQNTEWGYVLPSTGGSGTMPVYTAGTSLLLLAAWLVGKQRRRYSNRNA